MSQNSKIEWTDHTWSPWDGCTKVSPGCANCYAEARDRRHMIESVDHWGKGAPRRLRKDWNSPIKWNKEAICVKCWKAWPARGMHPDCDGEAQDFRRQRVFPSLCDWLDEEVPNIWLGRYLGLINATSNLTHQLLTKRPELFESRMKAVAGEAMPWAILAKRWLDGNAPSNVWVGTSVEDQPRANQRIPQLLMIPAVLRFVSYEPALAQVLWNHIDAEGGWSRDMFQIDALTGRHTDMGRPCRDVAKLDWIIIGGESGPNARPFCVENVADTLRQCRAAKVPCLVKQLGARPFTTNANLYDWPDGVELVEGKDQGFASSEIRLKHKKGGDWDEWPEEFRVREFPNET